MTVPSVPAQPGNAIVPTPPDGGGFDPSPGGGIGDLPIGTPTPPGTPRTPGEANPSAFETKPFDAKKFLAWLGALVVLWFVLTVMADSGEPAAAYSIAGLLMFGSLLFLGPKAIENAKAFAKG